MFRAVLVALTLPLLLGAATLGEEQRALAKANRDAAQALARARLLDRDADSARDAAGRAQAASAMVAARIQGAEADIAVAAARLRVIARLQRAQRSRLAAEQGPIVRLVGALQLMSRRPAVAVLARPGSTADLAHVRALLAGIMPIVRERTTGLRAELERGRALRATADRAATELRAGREQLEGDRLALARLEAAERARSRRFANSALFEQDRAVALGEDVRDITTLMGELEDQAALRDRLASLPGPRPRPARPGETPPPADAGRELQQRNPPYRLPVIGEVVAGLGAMSPDGVRARGLTVAVAPGALAVAPTRGRVAFAGQFRGYGNIVIIDHGDGWTTLITGLERLDVAVGDSVTQGAPLGRAGGGRPRITVELRRGGRPVDITPLVS